MPRGFNLRLPQNWTREPRIVVRLIIGLLLLANLIAAWAVISPVGGTPEELEAQIASLRTQLDQRRAALERTRNIASRVEQARLGTDQFLGSYFLPRRTASSAMVGELMRMAKEAGLRDKGHSFGFDEVEGSQDLSMMTVIGNYEGSYGDLLQFVNRLDKSPRFLIVDSLNATPMQATGNLNISVKMNTFVREGEPGAPPAAVSAAPAASSMTAGVASPGARP